MPYNAILVNVSKHIALTDEEAKYFISLLKLRRVRKRQYLLQAGDINRYENFVTKGCLRAYTVDDQGGEHIAMFALEGWWISDLYSFLTNTPATQHIDALEDSEVLSIEKSDLEKLYEEIPTFNKFFRKLFQNAFVAHQRRILTAISKTAEEQYMDFIARYPSIEQRVPQSQIASYLGLSPETISRIRRQNSQNRP